MRDVGESGPGDFFWGLVRDKILPCKIIFFRLSLKMPFLGMVFGRPPFLKNGIIQGANSRTSIITPCRSSKTTPPRIGGELHLIAAEMGRNAGHENVYDESPGNLSVKGT